MRRQKRLTGGLGVVVLIAVLVYTYVQNRNTDSPSKPPADSPSGSPVTEGQRVRCTRVVDGDTIIVEVSGKRERVRLVGINTPESVDPRRPVARFGKEAAAFAKKHLEGRDVELRFKPDERRDDHGRMLAYVHLDGDDFGARLIREGYAYSFRRYPHPRLDEYDRLEREARTARRGLWADPGNR